MQVRAWGGHKPGQRAPAQGHRPGHAGRQHGVATVLLLLLVGLTLTVMVLGSSAYLRQQQVYTLSNHAQTQAQLKAWTGAELVRQYLQHVRQQGQWTQLMGATFPQTLTLQGEGVDGVVEAQLTAVNTTAKTVTAQIVGMTAQGSPAEARVGLEVVYALPGSGGNGEEGTGGNGGTPAQPDHRVITFSRNLKLGGSINVLQDAGAEAYEISVIGDVSTDGNSITGVKKITSTGSIRIGSGSSFDELHANCDVFIDGSVTAKTINARRNACVLGGASVPGVLRANGSAKLESGVSQNGEVYARVNPEDVGACAAPGYSPPWNSAAASTCAAPAVRGVDLSAGSAGARQVQTAGDVTLASGTVTALTAQGKLTVNGDATVAGGRVGGTVSKPNWNNKINVQVTSGLVVDVSAVAKVEVAKETFNANDVRHLANYVFFVNAAGSKKVVVRHVAGIQDGEYFLADYDSGPYKDRLCTKVTGSGSSVRCADPLPAQSITLCKGYSEYNSCFAFNSKTQTWSINGTSAAPGIAWFQGNLEVGNGVYYNTFIASSNITTAGGTSVYAPNYAGYSGRVGGVQYAPTGVCENSYFPGLYPTDLCDKAAAKYLQTGLEGLGNYAMLAGSRSDENYADLASYVGGNITLGSSAYIYGSVKAGNEFTSGGSTTVHGYVTALAQGTAAKNSMGGSTTFDLRNLPKTMDPGGGKPGTPGTGGESTDPNAQVQVQWSRYL